MRRAVSRSLPKRVAGTAPASRLTGKNTMPDENYKQIGFKTEEVIECQVTITIC